MNSLRIKIIDDAPILELKRAGYGAAMLILDDRTASAPRGIRLIADAGDGPEDFADEIMHAIPGVLYAGKMCGISMYAGTGRVYDEVQRIVRSCFVV